MAASVKTQIALQDQKQKARKPKTCAQKQADIDRKQKALDDEKKRNADKKKDAKTKLDARQAKERTKLAAKHKREDDALDEKYGCTPKERKPRKPRKPKPEAAANDQPAAKTTAKARAKRKASKKKGNAKPAEGATPRPRATPATRGRVASRPTEAPAVRFLEDNPLEVSGELDASVGVPQIRKLVELAREAGRRGPHAVHVAAKGGAFTVALASDLGVLVAQAEADVRTIGAAELEGTDFAGLRLAGPAAERARLVVAGGVGRVELRGGSQPIRASKLSPPTIEPVKASVAVDAPALHRGLEAVTYAASRDVARISLNGILLDPRKDMGLVFVATDGHRLVAHFEQMNLEGAGAFAWSNFLLGLGDAELLSALLKGTRLAALARPGRDNLLVAGSSSVLWTLQTRAVKAVFPPYQKVVPKHFSHVCELPAAALRAALEPLARGKLKVGKAAAMRPSALGVYRDGELVFEQFTESGDAKSAVPIACRPGEGIRFRVDPRLLLDAVSHGPMAEANVSLDYLEEKSGGATLNPLRLRAAGEGWSTEALVMPMRE